MSAPPEPLSVGLITLGTPDRISGGYLYHRRMADLAPASGARVRFLCVPEGAKGWLTAAVVLDDARDCDVLVVDSIVASPLAPWLWRHPGPVVAVAHQSPGGTGGRLDRSAYRAVDLVIASGGVLVDELRSSGVEASRVRVVEPGCDLADPEPAGDLRRGRAAAVLCVANWLPGKDILSLLEAVARTPEGTVTVHLVGDDTPDGDYAARVRERLSREDLAHRVVVHGVVTVGRLSGLYDGADLFALPSRKESYGIAWAEALRAGLPVVGWRIGALERLVADGRQGILVEPGDVTALARALEGLALDETARSRMSEEARERGRGLPTWSETAQRFFAEVRQVAGR